MDNTTQHLTVNVQETTLSLSNPKQIMEFGRELEKYIVLNKLSVAIQNKNYCLADGWKWAGAAFGLTAVCGEPVAIHERGERVFTVSATRERSRNGQKWQEEYILYAGLQPCEKEFMECYMSKHQNVKETVRQHFNYKCTANIIRLSDGVSIGTGFATCSNLESKKLSFDEYAVYSMAQTRAIAKGFRNLLGYVMNAAGFEATPAEEMEEFIDKEESKPQEPQRPSMTEDQFSRTVEAVKAGKVHIDTIEKHYSLTDEQRKQLAPQPEPEKPKGKPGRKPSTKTKKK